jgi:hypothetical protein
MANIDAMFESHHWRGCDLSDGKTYTGIIKKVRQKEIPIPNSSRVDKKPVLEFVDCEKELVLNRINVETIKGKLGNDTDNWIGAAVELFQIRDAKFRGATVEAVRIRNVRPPKKQNYESEAALNQAVTAIQGATDQEALSALLDALRKQNWSKDQKSRIGTEKDQRLAELTEKKEGAK